MPTQSLLPAPKQRFYQSGGAVNAGGKVFTYAPGTNTKKATYSDSAGLVPNANPILLDARGEAIIYGTGSYKVVLALSTDADPPTSPIWSQDGVTIISDVTVANSNAADSAAAAAASAASIAKSTATAALISAIRINGFFPQPTTRVAAANIPAVVVGVAGAASTLNARASGQPLMLLSDTKFKWLSGPTSQDGNLYWQTRGAWYGASRTSQYASFEFNHTGTDFELATLGGFNATTNAIRVLVNGQIANSAGTIPTDGSLYFVRYTFPTSGNRRIRIEADSGRFRGVNVVAATEVAATGRTYPLITVMGDSFVEATGATRGYGGEVAVFAQLLGTNTAIQGVGATGILNPGTGGKVAWTDATRLTDLTMSGVTDALGVSTAPAMGVVMLSINDQGAIVAWWNGAATFEAAINKAVYTLIDAWQAANPGKPLVFFGPTWTTGTPQLDIYRIRDAAREAVQGIGGTAANVWFIDRLGPSPLLRTGTINYTTTTGNTNSNTTMNGLASTTNVIIGSGVIGTGIPDGTRVVTVDSATQVTLSNAATATAVGVAVTFKNDQAALYTNVQAGDVTHPDQRGHNYDGLWMAEQVRRLILAEFA